MTGTTGAKCLWITSLTTQQSNETAALIIFIYKVKNWESESNTARGAGFPLALPADTELSQIPGQGSQEENKNNFLSGPSQGETPDKQAGNLPHWIFSCLNQKSSIPFTCFKKKQKSSLSTIFLSWKTFHQPETGLRPTFLSGAGPALYPGVSHALGSSLGNNRHADLHCEAGPGASCCSPGTG